MPQCSLLFGVHDSEREGGVSSVGALVMWIRQFT